MRFIVTYQDPNTQNFDWYTVESSTYTMAMIRAKRECQRFGLVYVRMTDAHVHGKGRTLYQSLEYNATKERPRIRPEEYNVLMDIAYQARDQEWLEELKTRKDEER